MGKPLVNLTRGLGEVVGSVFSGPPKPPAPPKLPDIETEGAMAGEAERRRRSMRQGRASTILAGSAEQTSAKKLLGE